MIADIEEVDPDQPDEEKKDPFKSDKEKNKDTIRFRVTGLQWQEVEPLPPNVRNKPRDLDPETGIPREFTQEEIAAKGAQREQEAGLRIMASIEEQGLGNPEWWANT
ncbi:hypothetical protein QFC19_000585 [Naganishia cerealis]|uniref:Uncharacterized protein n=1 Tax=Naganishia cerealis TaxID=610337 RepID=A0ACC2WLF5_9TREE|nr:hypothetical protein QFC19_000585 [Naganishia cerealis]